jgi:hypothetical protein
MVNVEWEMLNVELRPTRAPRQFNIQNSTFTIQHFPLTHPRTQKPA